MARKRFAIITYDPDRLRQMSSQCDKPIMADQIMRALEGHTYEKGWALINITVMDAVELVPATLDNWKWGKDAS